MENKFYSFEKTSDTTADVFIYGDITSYEWDESDVSAWGFKKELEELGELSQLNVHINSYGGETFQGLAIYNLLKQHKAEVIVYIDGIAASSASIIAMAGDKVCMPKTALMMIHNCWTLAIGNSKELRKTAEDMDKIAIAYKEAYLSKVNIDEEKLDKLLEDESYLTADECIEMGFADKIVDLKPNSSINQNASMCLYKLVNKLKESEKDKIVQVVLPEDSIKNIIETSMKETCKEFLNGTSKGKPTGLYNEEKKDSLVGSFLNSFLKNEGGF